MKTTIWQPTPNFTMQMHCCGIVPVCFIGEKNGKQINDEGNTL